MEPRVILVPLDGSAAAQGALPYAVALARALRASVRLIAVAERLASPMTGFSRAAAARFDQEYWEALSTHLGEVSAALEADGLAVTSTLVQGQPADEILAAADEPDVAAVVMTTHGRGGVERLLIGSVADRVMRMSPRPVLLIRAEEGARAETPREFHRLMVPLDGSELAETALPPALELAQAVHATLVLVRVVPYVVLPAPNAGYLASIDRLDAEATAAAEAYLNAVQARLPRELRVETVVLRGTPALALAEYVRERGVDLTIMGTHGWGGLRRLVLGSTADRLVRAGVPALLVPPPPQRVDAGDNAPPTDARALGRRCATCGRLISGVVTDQSRCPRCNAHLHACANCVFWDGFACVLQRPEAHEPYWPGRNCPRFLFRETAAPPSAPTRTHEVR